MSELYYHIERWNETLKKWVLQAGSDTLKYAVENLKWYRQDKENLYRLVLVYTAEVILDQP
jgi:hypothetical protein